MGLEDADGESMGIKFDKTKTCPVESGRFQAGIASTGGEDV